jgi:tRNA A37 methylthiotransferase MiaB
VERARSLIPGVALSSDFISGFCGETDEEHADTVSLLAAVAFEQAFMFAYSKRDKTHAAYKMQDDVPPEVRPIMKWRYMAA